MTASNHKQLTMLGFGLSAVLGIILLIVLLWKGCDQKPIDKSVLIERDTVFKSDTTRLVERETIWQKYYVPLPTSIPENPVVLEEPKKPIDSAIVATFPRLLYMDSAEDETIKIHYSAYTRGILDSIRFKYFLKAPKTIKEKETNTVTNTGLITEKRYMPGFYVGISSLYLNKEFDIEAGAFLTTKKDMCFGYGYGLKNHSHRISAYYRIFPKKQ